jgi:hypothetical protein
MDGVVADGVGDCGAVVGLGVGVEVIDGVSVADAEADGDADAVPVMVAVDVAEGVSVDDAVAEGVLACSSAGVANAAPAGRANAPSTIAPTSADRRNLSFIDTPSAQWLFRPWQRSAERSR